MVSPAGILSIIVSLLFVRFCYKVKSNNSIIAMMEVCDNAIDDDGDGLIDLNDEDCACATVEPISLIPNPSFEDMFCCPQNRSQLDCAMSWIQASAPTTDYIHTCGWLGWPGLEPPQPYPDGNGVVGFRDGRNIQGNPEKNWKEYAGACLNSPMLAGTEYRFEYYLGFVSPTLSPPIKISFFGTTDCDNLPFGGGEESFGCPTNGPGWQLLEDRQVAGNAWVSTSITITPTEDIYAISIGPPCELTTSSENLYYFFDNLVLAESRLFDFEINLENSLCANDFRIMLPEKPGFTYQWYKNGIAIIGAISNSYLPNQKEGTYSAIVTVDGECKKTEDFNFFLPYDFVDQEVQICDEEQFDFNGLILTEPGIYLDTLKNRENCDSIISLNLGVQGVSQDFVNAKIFEGEVFAIANLQFFEEGVYDLTFVSSIGCDSLVQLDLSLYEIFIPNVFSPNDDGVNDAFEVFLGEVDLILEKIEIYSRWGSLVYSANANIDDLIPRWDGNINGNRALTGVYTYKISVELSNGSKKLLIGDLSLLR